jgi:hypothetical protein
MTENNILDLIKEDVWMMQVLTFAESMHLPDWLIGAGFLRNKVWDRLHGYTKSTPSTDIDLVYFDKENKINAKDIEVKLTNLTPGLMWEVVNQATAHNWNEAEEPYTSTSDAISRWPETATAVGVKIENGELKLIAPLGIDDLVNIIARPTPAFSISEKKKSLVQERISKKCWKEKWPKLKVVTE